jgi:hypothetical protein
MFLIWEGLGFIAFLFPFLFALLGEFSIDAIFGIGYYSSHAWSPALSLLISAPVIWYLGIKLNNKPGHVVIDPKTQREIIIRKRHTLFWIPLQYCSIVIIILSIVLFFHK